MQNGIGFLNCIAENKKIMGQSFHTSEEKKISNLNSIPNQILNQVPG